MNFINGFVSGLSDCLADTYSTFSAYENGQMNPLKLAAQFFGITEMAQEAGRRIDQLNAHVSTTFSNAPIRERLPAVVDVGWFSVSTAANIVGIAQVARGVQALSRSGTDGLQYAVEGSEHISDYVNGDKLFRVYGGDSAQTGYWASTNNPGNQINAINRLSLPPGNAGNMVSTVGVTGYKSAETSIASGLFNQPGGEFQVHWSDLTNLTFSAGRSLPIGFMPFSPPNLFSRAFFR